MSALAPQPSLPRELIEHEVRKSVYKHLGIALPRQALAPNPLLVNVSARHAHFTQETVEKLFGKGHRLTPIKWLYQKDQFAAKETVTLIGPRSRIISNLRILGPCRNIDQIELAFTDAVGLGFDIPVRQSGDIANTPGGMIMGPEGFVEMRQGILRAAPHVHMHPQDAAWHDVRQGDFMRLRIGGEVGATLDRLLVRVSPDFRLEVHIDTDEANACGYFPGKPCVLCKQ